MRWSSFLPLSILLITLLGLALPGNATAEDRPATGVVTADRLNVRSGPGTTHAVVVSVPQGTRLTILETGAEWVRVRTEGGEEGWASARYVAIEAAPSEPDPGVAPAAPAAPRAPRDDRAPSGGGGSALGSVLKWSTLAGGVVLAGLAWNEHSQGNDAYDDYESAVESGAKSPDDAEPLRQEAIDHDDKATLYAGVAGGLAALFLVQQFLLGGDPNETAVQAGPAAPEPPLVLTLRGGNLRAGLVLARF